MAIFVDTSGVYALLDEDESNHLAAARFWTSLIEEAQDLVTTNYVVVETCALLQRRLGMRAVHRYHAAAVPVLHVEWVDSSVHDTGRAVWLAANRRQLSLVDCVSFETMRRLGLDRAFAFDADFEAQGFVRLP